MVDLNAIKIIIKAKDENIVTILDKLGCHKINFKKSQRGREIRFALPQHNNSTSGVVLIENLYCQVYTPGCEYKGDLIGFVKFLKKIDFSDAIFWVCNVLNIDLDSLIPMIPIVPKINSFGKELLSLVKPKKLYNIREHEVDLFKIENSYKYVFGPHIELCREGIGTEVQEKFHIGYDLWSKRILFPHRFWNGKENEFVGIIGRTTNPFYDELGIPKYYPLKSYLKRTNLYGLWENLRERTPNNLDKSMKQIYRTIKDNHYLIIYEAEKSVLKRATWHDFTGVALMGHELQEEQISIINKLDDVYEVIFALDKDIPESKVKEMCNKIKSKRTSYMIDKNNLLGPTDSPADAKQSVFWSLFYSRVKNF